MTSTYYERSTATAGRGYVAAHDINSGEQIFRVNEPLATALNTKNLEDTCDRCFRTDEEEVTIGSSLSLKYCTGCRVVRYCSKVSRGFLLWVPVCWFSLPCSSRISGRFRSVCIVLRSTLQKSRN